MLVWLMIAIALAVLGVLEIMAGFTLPFTGLRTLMLFLLVLGMSYRIYVMERDGEKEKLKSRINELEDKLAASAGSPRQEDPAG